jgi:hypothetical protein
MAEYQKQDVFKLPQVVAATKKLTFTTDQIYNCDSEKGIRLNILSLLELLAFDNVLNFIINHFYETRLNKKDIPVLKDEYNTNSKQINVKERLLERFYSSKPKEKKERLTSVFEILKKYFKNGDKGLDIKSVYGLGPSPNTQRKKFVKEFVGYFYRDIMNMLIDLRVEAELSENKEVSKDYVVYIINGGNTQINQGNELDNSNATQNINPTQDQ